jgi:predicted hotdog family 3-hydroxylacyl-ACP dehydratase
VLIDRDGIARLIPHSGAMCLLSFVVRWDRDRIECAAASHRAADNPLRRDGRLGVLCGVEYASQAMAVHAALCAAAGGAGAGDAGTPRAGYLASLRDLRWHVERLDLLEGPLLVSAERLHGEAARALYSFALRHDGRCLIEGRAAVVIDAGAVAVGA